MSTTYPSDLSDAEWECAQRYLLPLSTRGRPRTHRRLATDDERKVQTSETLIDLAATRMLVRRLAEHVTPSDTGKP